MIKVLYLLNHAGKGGTESYVYSLIDSLNENKIKAFFAYNEYGPLVEKLQTLGIETFQIEMKNPFDMKAILKLSKLCRTLDIDLIHTHYLRENYIAILSRIFRHKTKVVYTYHFFMKNNIVMKIANRILTKFEANIIAVCNKGKEFMISNWMNASKIKVVFNGVDTKQWGNNEKATLRQELNISDDTYIILCVARFSEEKGHEFLIDALLKLKETTDKKFKCVFVGDGILLNEIKEMSNKLGLDEFVIFTGFRNDVKNIMAGSNLFINSSEIETLSIAIIEALAVGLPVIATDVGGNSDIINSKTKCGILVKYNDSKEMSEAIQKIMNDEKLQTYMSENARKAASEIFNIDIMLTQTYKIYMESK